MKSGQTRWGVRGIRPPTLCPKATEGAVPPADSTAARRAQAPCPSPRAPDILQRRATRAWRRMRGPGAPQPRPRPERGPSTQSSWRPPRGPALEEGGPGFWEHQAQDSPGCWSRASALAVETHRGSRLCPIRGKKPGNQLLQPQALWTESTAAPPRRSHWTQQVSRPECPLGQRRFQYILYIPQKP